MISLPDKIISAEAGFFVFVFVDFAIPMEIFPLGNSGRFPQEKPAATPSHYPSLISYKVHAESFRASIIHRTWITVSLTYIHDHSYVCVYTQGLGTPTESAQHF